MAIYESPQGLAVRVMRIFSYKPCGQSLAYRTWRYPTLEQFHEGQRMGHRLIGVSPRTVLLPANPMS